MEDSDHEVQHDSSHQTQQQVGRADPRDVLENCAFQLCHGFLISFDAPGGPTEVVQAVGRVPNQQDDEPYDSENDVPSEMVKDVHDCPSVKAMTLPRMPAHAQKKMVIPSSAIPIIMSFFSSIGVPAMAI